MGNSFETNGGGGGDIFDITRHRRSQNGDGGGGRGGNGLPPSLQRFFQNGPWLFLVVALALWGLSTSFFTIAPEETGVVLRFGANARTAAPGLHFKIPFGIEEVIKVPVQRQLKEEFGFRTESAGVRTKYSGRDYSNESNMLTGDLNAAVVGWVVQYRIIDPQSFLFRVRQVRETLRIMSEATMREVVGDRAVNEVLTTGRQAIAFEAQEKLSDLVTQYEMGIEITQVVLQDVTPPEAVKASFHAVNEAEQEKDRLIKQALSEYNRVIPKAKGEAQRTIAEAEGYAIGRVNKAKGDVAAFVALYDEYRRAPEITRQRLYYETMRDVVKRVDKTTIVDDDLEGLMPVYGNLGARK